jgi:MFS family permease
MYTVGFIILVLVGQITFAIAIAGGSFPLALAGQLVFGAGAGCVTVAQRAVVSGYFEGKEMNVAIGILLSISATAKFVGRASVAPLAIQFGGYKVAPWYTGIFIVLSLCCGITYWALSALARKIYRDQGILSRALGHHLHVPNTAAHVRSLTPKFWMLAIIHCAYLMIYHLFNNFSAHYLTENFHAGVVEAGYVSSLGVKHDNCAQNCCCNHDRVAAQAVMTIFLAPFSGHIIDTVRHEGVFLVACSTCTVLAYSLIAFSGLNPSGACLSLCTNV